MNRKERLNKISHALSQFSILDLRSASLNLLQALGYASNTTTNLSSPDQVGFDQFAKHSQFYSSFNKVNALFEQWQEVQILFQLTDEDIRYTNQISLFQPEFRHDLYDSYLFMAIDLGKGNKAKYKLATITREINKLLPMPVMILYKTGDVISFAIINRRYNKNDRERHVLEKVTTIKDISIIDDPHRAHKEILSDMSLDGLLEQGFEVNSFLSLHKAWRYVLNTEELNRRFFINIRDWFYQARRTVRFPINGNDSERAKTENLIRLLTRMIFIWFIKEKGLVDKRLFDIDILKIEYLNPECKEHSQYYKAILQNLFFATLNNEMNKDDPEFRRQFMPDKKYFTEGHRNQFYYRYGRMFRDVNQALELFEPTPFLNGGLFECLDNDKTKERKDYFTNPIENRDLIYVPDELFFAFDKKGNPIGLIDIFKHYKFTVEENTPIEEEIALDPELLGKVFESLLSEWDSEYNETKKKHTGSYYTPREIVDYMVSEALITHLDTVCKEQDICLTNKIRQLFEYSSLVPDFSFNETQILVQSLSNVKILDPACGSGAFPMGMLHKIVYVLGKLDPGNVLFKEEQKQIAQRAINEDIEKANEINDLDARREAEDVLIRKMERLEEVFGEDNPEYFDYARKLYVIENCIYGVDIQPTAIQIAKLRFFVSLIIEQEKSDKKNYGLIPLPNLETKLIAANSLIPLMMQIKNEIFYKEIEPIENRLRELRKKYFFSKSNSEKRQLRNDDDSLRAKLKGKIKPYGISDEIDAIISWNPYESSSYADFFDPFWMFSIDRKADEDLIDKEDKEPTYNKVFDIVIGNPPYVRADNPAIKEQRKLISNSKYYQTIWEKWDLYIPFLERSFKLLKPNGLISYIISDAYIASKYAEKSQEYFVKNAIINRIDFLSDIKVFDAAVRNVIIQIQNCLDAENVPLRLVHKEMFGNMENIQGSSQSVYGTDLFKPYSKDIVGAMGNTITWGEICYVSVGMVLNAHEALCKGSFTKDDLIANYADKVHSRPYVEAKWIERYLCKTYKYLEWGTDRVPDSVRRPTFPELYQHPKIMMGGMTGAIYDDSNLICNHSITVSVLWKDLKEVNNKSIISSIRKDFQPSENLASFRDKLEKTSDLYDLKYLLAILNSSYAKYFLKTVQRSQIGVYPDDIKKIPIPAISKERQNHFCILVDYITYLKSYEQPLLEIVDNGILAKEFDRVLDAMVMELYFANEMSDASLSFIDHINTDFCPLNAKDDLRENHDHIRSAYSSLAMKDNPIRNNLILLDIRLDTVLLKLRKQ